MSRSQPMVLFTSLVLLNLATGLRSKLILMLEMESHLRAIERFLNGQQKKTMSIKMTGHTVKKKIVDITS